MKYKMILYKKTDGIARLTFNRPEKRNAFTWDMLDEITHALKDAKTDEKVKLLIITGKGDAFSSGMDVSQISDVMSDRLMPTAVIVSELKDFEKPSIAMVNGPAVGAAVDVAIFCDFAVAVPEAFFWYSYIRRGAIPSVGSWLMPRIIGVKEAMRMLLLSEKISADEAKQMGMVYKVVSKSNLEKAAMELAERLRNMPLTAYQFTKRTIFKGLEWDLKTTTDFTMFARAVASKQKEYDEGVSAFFEKREATFK